MARGVAVILLLALSCFSSEVEAFYPPSIILGRRARKYGVSGARNWQLFAGSGFWKQRPGESDKEFFQRISQAASSPESFASASFGDNDDKKKEHSIVNGNNNKSPKDGSDEEGDDDDDDDDDETQGPKKKRGYQRAEDWDAEQKERKANGEMTWEERVQFEGQRQGNQFKQNEILRNNIKWGR